MVLSLNPKVELFRWGPIPGRFLYSSVFTYINIKPFRKKYKGCGWPETLYLFGDDKRVLWVNEKSAVDKECKKVFVSYVLPKKIRQKIYLIWQKEIKKLLHWHQYINSLDLAGLTNQELLSLWHDYHADYCNFWVDGMIPELGGYGADKMFKDKLIKVLPENELNRVLEILTTPTKLSFYQKEEVDLVKAKDLKNHQDKYFWLQNSYAGSVVSSLAWFANRKKNINTEIENKVRNNIKKIIKEKIKVKKRFDLAKEIMDIARAISDCISWQDERKENIFKVIHFEDLVITEVSRRTKYSKDDLLNCWFWEVGQILKGKDFKQELKKRRKGFGVQFYKNYKMLSGNENSRYWNLYTTEKIDVNVKEVCGLVVSRGKSGSIVRGRAKVLLDPNKIDNFAIGDILVAPMTSPEYIFAIRRSSAIITDTGGLTSHAAIVSRELGVPCVVGTKIATKIFKDGDLVEVDINSGIIKKL